MNAKSILVILVLAGAGLGAYWFLSRPEKVPDLVLKDTSGEEVSLSGLMEDKSDLLVVVLLPGCRVCQFSMEQILQLYPDYSDRLAFVGIMLQGQLAAEQFAEKHDLPYPVFGLKAAADPFIAQEFMTVVGMPRGSGYAVYGGTVAVIDSEMRVQIKLEREGLRELPDKLAAYLD